MKFLNWLVFSSENPREVSRTIMGILVLQIPIFVSFLQEAGVNVIESKLTAYATAAVAIFGALLTLVGFALKIYNTFSEEEVVAFKAKKKKVSK